MVNVLPRWRGFNLLDMYVYEEGRERICAGDLVPPPGVGGNLFGGGEGDFREEEFRWMGEWGFDFVRVPMDYRYWTEYVAGGGWRLRENVMGRIDRVVEMGGKYGLHVSLSFHRAPGYCVNPPAEAKSLWTDLGMQGMFAAQWRAFAERYKGVSSERLSFDLVNEPPAVGVMGFLGGSGMTRGAHERVIRGAVGAIRAVDGERLIMVNGLNYGTEVVEEIVDLSGVGQSCRMYGPFGISHYEAPWVKYVWWKKPVWPGADHFGRWGALARSGVGVHCGEGGFFSRTPHEVGLAWMRDAFEILKGEGIGWALWNLRGGFGVLDSERSDVQYADWHGHKLDVQMLELLRKS